MPARRRRAASHGGVGRVASTPETVRATKRVAPGSPWIGASSSMRTAGPASSAAGGWTAAAGSVKGTPVACAYSRATPRIENA